MSDLVTAKCVAAAGCISSIAGITEALGWYSPPFVCGVSGALMAYVLDPPEEPLTPLQVLWRSLASGIFAAASTPFIVERYDLSGFASVVALAMVLGAIAPMVVKGLRTLSFSKALSIWNDFMNWRSNKNG